MSAKERPILFSAPMVRAIRDGRKSQTRRVVKPVRGFEENNVCRPDLAEDNHAVWWHGEYETVGCLQDCPYGQPGDRLWVRESYRLCAEADAVKARDTDAGYRVWYEADAPHQPGEGKLRPGIFMPRWASRITLEVTGVRVERLQDISELDAIAEGLDRVPDGAAQFGVKGLARSWHNDPRVGYRHLWESINGPGSCDANPWVWVVEFRRVQPA